MSTPFTWWLAVCGGIVASCGWLMLLVMIARALQRRVHTSRPPGRDRVVAVQVASRVATTLLMPAVPGRHRTGRNPAPLGSDRSASSRLEGVAQNTPRRAVAAPCWGWGAATLTLPVPGRAASTSDPSGWASSPGRVYIGTKEWTRAAVAVNDGSPLENTHR